MAFKTSEVLRHVMAERQLTQTDLARELGVRPQSVQQWVSGKTRPAGKNLEALSVYLGLSPAVITTGTTEGRTTVDLEDGTISIPRFSVYGSCGTGYPNEFPKVVSMVLTTRDWLEAKCPGIPLGHLEVLTARGDSMRPTIKNLDFVFVDRSAKAFREEGVYVVTIGGDTLIKRLQRRLDGGLNLLSDNPQYPLLEVPLEDMDRVVVEGKVCIICSANEV